jgi:hypothetical protein
LLLLLLLLLGVAAAAAAGCLALKNTTNKLEENQDTKHRVNSSACVNLLSLFCLKYGAAASTSAAAMSKQL